MSARFGRGSGLVSRCRSTALCGTIATNRPLSCSLLAANLHVPSDNRMYQTQIRQILESHGRLSVDVQALQDESDLYNAGLTSLITVNLLLAVEDHFDVEFPDHMLTRGTFQSINTLAEAVEDLLT